MNYPAPVLARAIILVAGAIGGASLLAFLVFLFSGPVQLLKLSSTATSALLIDGILCCGFFAQHSGMVRQSYQEWQARYLPRQLTGATYAIASGLTLIALLVLWQPSELLLFTVGGPFRWVLRGLFLAGLVGFVAGVQALGFFDPFGVRPIKAMVSGRKLRQLPLTIRGPYRWVRHPLYTCMLILMWSYPELTADRLLFNIAWTIWVFIGATLEERDLVTLFGGDYQRYQRDVPMLIPLWRFHITRT